MEKVNYQKIFIIIFQLIIIFVLSYFLVSSSGLDFPNFNSQNQTGSVFAAQNSSTPFPIAETRVIEPFSFLNLSAKSVVVYDIKNNKVIFSQGKDDILPIASLTKLMTVYTANKFLRAEDIITITGEDILLDGYSPLTQGENWRLKNLTALTLISSSNAGANAIAREAEKKSQSNFVFEMNETAKELGLQNTYFRNPTGLDLAEATVSGANSTAQDVAYLFAHIFKNNPNLLSDTNKNYLSVSSLDNVIHQVNNTNQINNKIPNLISSKTGTTLLAGGNLAVVFNPAENNPVVIVVLGSSPAGRFEDMEKLVRDTVKVYRAK